MHHLIVALYTIVAGFTASGIVANLYRVIVERTKAKAVMPLHAAIMVVAGPNVLFENAAKGFRAKHCSGVAFSLAALVAGYWSFLLGLFLLELILAA